jgi:hypothetical protein
VLTSWITVSLRGQGAPNSTSTGHSRDAKDIRRYLVPSCKKPDLAKIEELINDNTVGRAKCRLR